VFAETVVKERNTNDCMIMTWFAWVEEVWQMLEYTGSWIGVCINNENRIWIVGMLT
jgi:hypothetical protein